MSTTAKREWAGINVWPCWHADGWECAAEWSVRDARVVTRAQAHASATYDLAWVDVRVRKRYLRELTLQEQWEHHADNESWTEADPNGPDGAERDMSETPPEDWKPHEDIPEWTFCHPTDPGSVPVWIVSDKQDRPPHRTPAPANPTLRAHLLEIFRGASA